MLWRYKTNPFSVSQMTYTTIVNAGLAILWLGFNAPVASAQTVGQPLPAWQEGEMDIHHINTGMGNAAFMILPDGTTFLVDAGALDPTEARTQSPRNTKAKPSAERQPGEWIARYIRKVSKAPVVDYALMTHFHDDHMGTPTSVSRRSEKGKYALAGITEVAEFVPVKKIIDRGWPDYSYPRPSEDAMMQNYRTFLDW